jgi:outer membrane protein TolC
MNSMHKRKILLLGFICFVWMSLSGQGKLTLSLEQAVNYAVEYNKTINNADLAVHEAQKKINESIFGGLPQVSASVDYSNFMGAEMELSFAEDMPPTIIPFKPTSNFNLKVGQLIFSGSYIVGLQTVKIYKELSVTNLYKTEQNVKEQVTKSYLLALASQRSIDIINKNLDNTKDMFEKTKVMATVGMAEKLDVDQFKVQLNLLENAKKSAERQEEMAFNLLRFQLGVSVDTPVELTDSLSGLVKRLDTDTISADPFRLENNLDYQLMVTQEKLSQKQISLKKMNYLPTVSGFYQHTEKILKPELDFSPKNVIGLNVDIPIFSSGMRNAQLSQARIQYETTVNNKSLVCDQLYLQEKQCRFNLINAMEQYNNRLENIDVAYRVYQNYKLKYEQGVASSLDLSTANNNYLQAESDYIGALINLFDAHLELQKLMNSL